MAVGEELLGHLVAGRQEHRGPEHAMEAEDALAEHVTGGRPVHRNEILARPRVGERAQVVDERVSPDVGDLALVPGQRDAPGLARAADREVLEATGDEAPRLVVAEVRQHEFRSLVVERKQPLFVRGQPEEVVLLLDVLNAIAVLRALAVDELILGLELLTADAIQTGIDVFVDVPVVVDALEEAADELLVAVIRRSNVEVGLGSDGLRQRAPHLADAIDVLLCLEALLLSDSVDLRRMLVHPGKQERVVSPLTVMPDEDVGRDRRVRVPEVRGRVHVVDRRGQVVAHSCGY